MSEELDRIYMECPDCHWVINQYMKVLHACEVHRDPDELHYFDDEYEETWCGAAEENIQFTGDSEEVTCPICQVNMLNNVMFRT